jgi:hypothetical protein
MENGDGLDNDSCDSIADKDIEWEQLRKWTVSHKTKSEECQDRRTRKIDRKERRRIESRRSKQP